MSRPDFKFIEFVADASAACMNTKANFVCCRETTKKQSIHLEIQNND